MRSHFLLLMSFLVASLSPGCAKKSQEAPNPSGPEYKISAESVGAHVDKLASDEMQGRGLGTAGIESASNYLAIQFAANGLVPGGDLDDKGTRTWFQSFDMTTGVESGKKNALKTVVTPQATKRKAKPATQTWNVSKDWAPLGLSEAGTHTGGVAFVGYGISAPEFDYDDYAGIDVDGKFVLVMRHEPNETNPHSPFAGDKWSRYAELRFKAVNAREHGAKGILLVNDILGHEKDPDELIKLEQDPTGFGAGLLAAHVKRTFADKLLAGSGKSLHDLQKAIDDLGKPQSFNIDKVEITTTIDLLKKKTVTRNVVAFLPGQDPVLKDEVVVVGAHYDGLGFGGESSLDPDKKGEVHNGADDNASGTAALLEIARALSGRPDRRRSLLFVAFSAEETGLGGSTHFVKNPTPVALSSIVSMVNMDMIGRLQNDQLIMFGTETATEFPSLIAHLNTEGLKISPHGDGYGPSDHTPFYSKRIPVLHFFTGAHEDYHRTSDDAAAINRQGLAQVTSVVTHAVHTLTEMNTRPTYAAPSAAPTAVGSVSGDRGYGAYLGTIPDFTEREEAGVKLTGVRKGSPAELAGLKEGDVLLKLGTVDIKNLYDLSFALRQFKPGEKLIVEYERAKEKKTSEVTLTKREEK